MSKLASCGAPWPAGWPLAYSDPGGGAHLGDQGRVTHGGRQADSQPLEVAVDDVRLGDQAECAKVTQADPCQDDVAQLAAGRLDHRSVPKSVHQIGWVFKTNNNKKNHPTNEAAQPASQTLTTLLWPCVLLLRHILENVFACCHILVQLLQETSPNL